VGKKVKKELHMQAENMDFRHIPLYEFFSTSKILGPRFSKKSQEVIFLGMKSVQCLARKIQHMGDLANWGCPLIGLSI
jgi:hypothetical protein